MFVFRKIRRALFSWNTHFETCPSVLLSTNYVTGFCKLHAAQYSLVIMLERWRQAIDKVYNIIFMQVL